MQLKKTKQTIKNFFDSMNTLTIVEQTFQMDEMKKEFAESLNEVFGKDGIYFEMQDNKIEYVGSKPVVGFPKFNICHHKVQQPIGILDAQNKSLTLLCEERIETIHKKVMEIKKSILNLNQEVEKNSDELTRRKWNLFIRLFRKKQIRRLELELNSIQEELQRSQNHLQLHHLLLDTENEVYDVATMLLQEFAELGVHIN